ncbi:hydroxyacid dehydrogenase [Saccharothrix algeriensis]|uniref:D-3-phosphoglycerate dehydrogenase n=2 Tax=Saccharothrix algeriensis TaxID=173560 RepID=A0ABS2SDZ6_9PSEU|nr:hydroxyacid dehydrogenase [Saccharothrix algeriensis]MBM7814461.1 D-3-phosphoglycerate dehydrogenase [Saccharothrix algeriensis]
MLDPIHAEAVDRMRADFDVVIRLQPPPDLLPDLVSDVDAVVLRSGARLPAEVFERARRLKVVARAGSGVDNIDQDAARRAGVQVFNVPGGSAGAVAELAIGLALNVMRRISLADRQVRADVWNKHALEGDGLAGKTLGIIGFGNIGSRIARIASGFSPRILATARRLSESRRTELADRGVELVDLPRLLADSDVVCAAVPLTDRTRSMIGAAQLGAMKPTAYLVNVSRGGVVDETALLAALRGGVIRGAALDVHVDEGSTSPLTRLDNVVLTPHIGAMSADAQRAIGHVVVDSLVLALDGGDVPNRVC